MSRDRWPWVAAGLLFILLTSSSQATPEQQLRETGVVVDEVPEGSALEKAGLEPADILHSWERLPNATSPQGAQGELRSPFDWQWLEVEQAPRGTLRFNGKRNQEPRAWTVEPGLWKAKVRPTFPATRRSEFLRGQELIAAGDLASGALLWEKLAAREELGPLRCWLHLQLGDAWFDERAWEKAHAAYRSALEAASEPVAQVAVWVAVGRIYRRQNNLDQAEASFRSALEIYRETWGESLGFTLSLNKLGLVAIRRGHLDVAAEHHQRALAIREKLAPDSLDVAGSLNNLGIVAGLRGQFEQAAEHVQRALAIQEKLAPENLNVATSLNNLGINAHKRGQLDVAAERYQRALAIREKLAPDSLDVAGSHTNLGSVAYDRNQLDVAAKHLQRALETQEKLAPGGLDVAASLAYLGNVAWKRDQLEVAAKHYQRALAIQEKLALDSLAMATSLNDLGNIAQIRGQIDLAESYFARSLDALEAQIGNLGGSQWVKGGFRAQHRRFYRDAIELLLLNNRPEEAFAILERSRARSFLAMLEERDLIFSDIPEELDRQRRSLGFHSNQRMRHLASLSSTEDRERIETLRGELTRLYQERDELRAKIRQQSPHLANLQEPQPLTLADVQGILDPATVMLSYSIGEEQTNLFVVTSGQPVAVHTLDVGKDKLQAEVGYFRELIETAQSDDFLGHRRRTEVEEVGRRLYAWLVEPAQDAVATGHRVLLVPDGPLHRLPFAALIRDLGANNAAVGRDWQYFSEWKPLHSVLSATVYAELAQSRPTTPPAVDSGPLLAAFGDPHYFPNPEHTVSLEESKAENTRGGGRPITDARVRSARARCGFDLRRLPASRREVLGISALHRNVRTYLGQGAREESVKSLDSDVRILHIAAHGCLDDRFPLNSGLFLTLPEGFPKGRDNGLLQAWEIFESVRLNADLVVLSACESGLGEEQGGEGLVGLTRAFQYAGARTVAATLWQVEDQVTAELMVRFYRHLRAGKTKDVALQAAQIELIQGPIAVRNEDGQVRQIDASAPYYWAAFQLLGDWQ